MTSVLDRELRRIVLDLAALQQEDRDAVLGELDAGQRQAVRRLLREFTGSGSQDPAAVDAVPGCDVSGLSPWLVERMTAHGDSGITTVAREALRDCALRLYPKEQIVRSPGALSRLVTLATGRTSP